MTRIWIDDGEWDSLNAYSDTDSTTVGDVIDVIIETWREDGDDGDYFEAISDVLKDHEHFDDFLKENMPPDYMTPLAAARRDRAIKKKIDDAISAMTPEERKRPIDEIMDDIWEDEDENYTEEPPDDG